MRRKCEFGTCGSSALPFSAYCRFHSSFKVRYALSESFVEGVFFQKTAMDLVEIQPCMECLTRDAQHVVFICDECAENESLDEGFSFNP